MEQETEPLQQKNNIKSEKQFKYKIYCSKCIFLIFVIVMCWLLLCYGERNLPSQQQICKY